MLTFDAGFAPEDPMVAARRWQVRRLSGVLLRVDGSEADEIQTQLDL